MPNNKPIRNAGSRRGSNSSTAPKKVNMGRLSSAVSSSTKTSGGGRRPGGKPKPKLS